MIYSNAVVTLLQVRLNRVLQDAEVLLDSQVNKDLTLETDTWAASFKQWWNKTFNFFALKCYWLVAVLTGVGSPGPPGERGEPGSFVPTSGWWKKSHLRCIVGPQTTGHTVCHIYLQCLCMAYLMYSSRFCPRNLLCWTPRTPRTCRPTGSRRQVWQIRFFWSEESKKNKKEHYIIDSCWGWKIWP